MAVSLYVKVFQQKLFATSFSFINDGIHALPYTHPKRSPCAVRKMVPAIWTDFFYIVDSGHVDK